MPKMDAVLCCTASFPVAINLAVVGLDVMMTMMMTSLDDESSIDLERARNERRMLLWLKLLAGLGSFCTAPVGMYFLQKAKQRKAVPRGCDCCCSCPCPAWSLCLLLPVLRLWTLTLIGIFGAGAGSELEIITLVAGVMDVAYGSLWVHALCVQDGNCCCDPSRAEATVVGKPVVCQSIEANARMPTPAVVGSEGVAEGEVLSG